MKRNKLSQMKWVTTLLLAMVFILAACGGNEASPGDTSTNLPGENNQTPSPTTPTPEPAKPKTPYKMIIHGGGVKPEEFDDRFRSVIEKKFEHITFEYYQSGKGTTMSELVAAGEIPDIIRTDIPTLLTNYLDLGLGQDLSEYIKQHNYDINRFNKVFLDEIIEVGGSSALYGLPVPPFFPQVLYYNIDIFDQRGVDHLTDGMTWDEVYDLARRLTYTDGDTQVRGFSFNPRSGLRDNPFSLPILDPQNDGLADMEKWKDIIDNFRRFYEIQGNVHANTVSAENTAFNNGNVAMQANQHSVYLYLPEELNWDMVSYPMMNGAPELMPQRGPAYWALSQTSKHKDEAFEVIMAMISDDVQLADSKKGIPTTLNNKEIQDALGSEHPVYQTKNMAAVSYYQPAPYTAKRESGLVDVPLNAQMIIIGDTFMDIVLKGVDVNTALRQADEKIKAEIEKEKAKN